MFYLQVDCRCAKNNDSATSRSIICLLRGEWIPEYRVERKCVQTVGKRLNNLYILKADESIFSFISRVRFRRWEFGGLPCPGDPSSRDQVSDKPSICVHIFLKFYREIFFFCYKRNVFTLFRVPSQSGVSHFSFGLTLGPAGFDLTIPGRYLHSW